MLVSEKSEAFVPVIVRLVIGSANLAALVKVEVFGALVLPTVTVPKFRIVGTSLTQVPVPVRDAVWGLPVALSVTVTDPVMVCSFPGTKVTVIVQLAPAARLLPQLLV